jgi:hypothetical protein
VDETFATNPDTPSAGLSLYQFSVGHGGLFCEACHGSTHAEYPSTQRNDNIQSRQRQGHVGMLVECTACHASVPSTVDGGPHGMHPVGAVWVERHSDAIEEGGATACRACHGSDYRGTVLSRVQADRTIDTENFGRKQFWRGFQVGCYTCHRGPSDSGANPNRAPMAADTSASTTEGNAVSLALGAHDDDGDALALRIVSQPQHGTVGLNGTTATFFPEAGFVGGDAFTFAAWDGSTDSNLATVSLTVSAAPVCSCPGDCDGNSVVTIEEVVGAVVSAIHGAATGCLCVDTNHDGRVTIDEVLRSVDAALKGCSL